MSPARERPEISDAEEPVTGCGVTLWVEGVADPEQAESLVGRMLVAARREADETTAAAVLGLNLIPGATRVEISVVPE